MQCIATAFNTIKLNHTTHSTARLCSSRIGGNEREIEDGRAEVVGQHSTLATAVGKTFARVRKTLIYENLRHQKSQLSLTGLLIS